MILRSLILFVVGNLNLQKSVKNMCLSQVIDIDSLYILSLVAKEKIA